MALFPGLPKWAGTRKVKPISILLKQDSVNSSGISWAICKSAPRSRQTTTPAPHHSGFYRPDALPATQPTASTHWRQVLYHWYLMYIGMLVCGVASYSMCHINGFIVLQSKGQAVENTSALADAVVSNGVQHSAAAMPLKVSFTSLVIFSSICEV